MKASDVEDIAARVALDLFNYRHPDFNVLENPKSMQTCIEDSAFVISKFIAYFNEEVEREVGK
jgi:hypothetical protein